MDPSTSKLKRSATSKARKQKQKDGSAAITDIKPVKQFSSDKGNQIKNLAPEILEKIEENSNSEMEKSSRWGGSRKETQSYRESRKSKKSTKISKEGIEAKNKELLNKVP